MSIKVAGPWPAWDGKARRGHLQRADGSTAEVLLHPGTGTPPATLEAARAEGRRIAGGRHGNALHLKQVMGVSGAPLWVYDGFAGASLGRVVQELAAQGRLVPVRAVVELGQAVVDALGDLTTGSPDADGRVVVHPGVTPWHVLLAPDGQLKVVGFRAPLPGAALEAPAGYPPPEGGLSGPALVYGVGALLCELLTGEAPPSAAPDADRHAGAVRRGLIRVLSRPGTRVPEAVIELVRACLSFSARDRPSLPRLSVRLAGVAADLPSPGLATWAAETLPAVWARLTATGEPAAPPVRPQAGRTAPAAAHAGAGGVDLAAAPPTEEGTAARMVVAPDAQTENDTEEVERAQAPAEDPLDAGPADPGPVAVSAPVAAPALAAPVAAPTPAPVAGPAPRPRPPAPAAPVPALAAPVPALAAPAPGVSARAPRPRPPAPLGPDLDPAGIAPMADSATEEADPAPWDPRPARWPWLVGAAAAVVALAGGWWVLGRGPEAAPVEVPEVGADDPGRPDLDALIEAEPAATEPAATEPAATEPAATEPAATGPAATAPPVSAPPVTAPPVSAPTTTPSTRARVEAEASDEASDEVADEAWIRPSQPAATSSAATSATPTTASPPPVAATVATAPDPPPYTLRFSSSYEAVQRLDVTCHGGHTGSGASVTIQDAVPGPCRIEATTADGGRLVALVSATGDRSWTCFAAGERTCR